MLPLLVYGATGYTGELVARAAAARGLPLLLAARRAEPLARLARELDCEHLALALDDAAALDAALLRSSAVLHCAGPFLLTFRAMSAACLRTRRPYVDITGEQPVMKGLAALDADAREAGILLLPGAGFDVVPTDTLAVHVARRLPSADRIVLALRGFGRISGGTARTLVLGLSHAAELTRGAARPREPRRTFAAGTLGEGAVTGLALPSADVWAARRSTGVADVTFYMGLPRAIRLAVRGLALAAPLAPLLRVPQVSDLAVRALTGGRAGPTEADRARGRVHLFAEATDRAGGRAAARMTTPDGYAFTAAAVVAVAERILAGDAPAGFHTPSSAYGPDLALAVAGVTREDVK